MSEFIAEARVLVTPDTTKFRELLVTELAGIQKTLPPIPVTVTPVVSATAAQASTAAAVAAQEELAAASAASASAAAAQQAQIARVAASQRAGAIAASENAGATNADTVARRVNTGVVANQARTFGGLGKGAGSAAASLLGVRGATLAATGPFIAGAAGAIAFGKALSIATGFTQQLSVFAAVTGATADEMERVSQAAQTLGKDLTLPGVSASDAAEAMTEFAKAGLSVNDAIAATRGGLQLATAAQLSNADAVELTANALNAFKLSGDQAVGVADTLANAANAAQGSIADIGLGLKQAAGAAAVVGVNFEDTVALLTLLAKNGLTASDAGTSLRTAFIRLVNPSKQASEILRDLNVQLRDAQGNVRPEAFAEFAEAQRNLSVATQQANAAVVFGQDAFRAFGVLSREGASGLQEVRSELEQTGTAAKVAGARMTGVAGATANLKNQMEALGLTIGRGASPALEVLLDNLAGVVKGMNDGASAVKGFAAELSKIGAGADQQEDPFRQVKDIGSFLVGTNIFNIKSQIQDLVEGPKEEIGSAGAELRSAIEDAAREAAKGAVSFGDQITGALDAAFALVNKTVADATKKFRAGQFAAVGRAAGQQSGLEEIFNQIVASGGSQQQQIANLRRQAQVQAKIIAEAGPNAAGDLLKARREAQAKLASINQQIVAIEKSIAADQKAANDERQRVQDQAKADRDRAFLLQQEDARTAQQRLITRADDTPTLRDDIARQAQLRDLITRQIAAIKASAVDEKTKQAALRDLRNARNQTIDEIKRLRDTDKKQRQEQAAQAAEALASARLDLAQTTFDLTGEKGPLQRALDAKIKQQIAIKNAAKKGSLAFIQAQTEIRRLLKQRKDLNDEVKKDAGTEDRGLTAFDILKQNAETFNQTGGNLVTGNQPFAGPTGFTADVAQFLHRPPVVQMQLPKADFAAPLVSSNAELIRVIQENTDAIRGSTGQGNDATGTGTGFSGAGRWWARSFYASRVARQLTESESP